MAKRFCIFAKVVKMDSWDDLRVFLAVARGESLSAAGRALKIDPATAGRRIARLEMRLGTPLFAKSPQGYGLSEAGQRLMDHALRAEQAMQAAQDDLAGEGGDRLSGQLRIGAPDGCANFLLPQVCAQICAQNPDLDIQIVALPRVVNLSKREADMAITVSPPSAGRLSVQKITDYQLHFAAAAAYLDNAPPLDKLDDLHHHRVIGYIPDMIFDKELDYMADLGLSRVALASNSAAVQFNLLRQGAGIGIVHDFALPSDPSMRRVLPQAFALTRSFYLVRHDDDRRLERMNRLAIMLVNEMRGQTRALEAAAAFS